MLQNKQKKKCALLSESTEEMCVLSLESASNVQDGGMDACKRMQLLLQSAHLHMCRRRGIAGQLKWLSVQRAARDAVAHMGCHASMFTSMAILLIQWVGLLLFYTQGTRPTQLARELLA